MQFLFLSILFFVSYGAVSAQSIFIPFKGRLEAVKTADFTAEELSGLEKGTPCGQYFSYEGIADQKILTFKVSISDEEKRRGVNYFNRVGLKLLKIKIDDNLKVPMIEYRATKSDSAKTKSLTGMFIISLSAQDFREAPCLSTLR